ncbi:MAG: glycosyltransferase [Bacteroidetes bacterium]|nr:glycosyltransferase [Bacteroidota bacterium]
MLKVLQLCHKIPYPAQDGGAQVIHFTTQGLLNKGIELKIIAINPTRNFVPLHSLPIEYKQSTRFEAITVDTAIKPVRFLLNLLKKESYFIERFKSNEFENKLSTVLLAESFDIIQLEHLYLCIYLPILRKFSKAKIILRPQNVEYQIWEGYQNQVKNPVKKLLLKIATARLKKYEQNTVKCVDGILALTKNDAVVFSSFVSTVPIEIIAMGYEYSKLKEYNFENQFLNKPVVYHLGAMDWLPNVEAIDWFLDKVLPILQSKKAGVKIILAGRNMPNKYFTYQSDMLEINAEVYEPLKFQEDKPILIVPLLSGSGIRAKIIEGLALGKTIISTNIGAQGINFTNGKDLIIADTAEDFANQIIRYASSIEMCKSVSLEARKLSRSYYTSEVTSTNMIEFYTKLLKN